MSFKFSKPTLKELNRVFDSIHLPGSIEDNTHKIIRRIFIEEFSIYIDVLKWKITSKNISHIAFFIYREFKTQLNIYYLDNNAEYERLISNRVKFAEYCYDYLEDSFYKHVVLLNPFIGKYKRTTKYLDEIRARKISDTMAGRTSKMPLILKVIDDMDKKGYNFGYAVSQNTPSNTDPETEAKGIRGWMNTQLKRYQQGRVANHILTAQKLKELIVKNFRNKDK